MKTFKQFSEQAYSSKAQIDEGLVSLGTKAMQYGTKAMQYGTKAFRVVKGLLPKAKPRRIPAGDIGAMRLRQGQATDAVNRLNRSTAASKANDATRAATRETNRLNNLDPRAVSDANKRREATQIMQRNIEMGRPSWYNPNNPGSKEALRRYNADKRSGIRGLPE